MGKTLYDKLWDAHVVEQRDDGTSLIYIDRHLIHEVTSPQAFEGLRLANRQLWRIDANLCMPDHNVSTDSEERSRGMEGIVDPTSRIQVETLADNVRAYSLPGFSMDDPRQGIVHVVGPEQGATLPGMTVVCGDSHTSTHGALAALAHGIGTSEVEHVLATQCLVQKKMRNMLVEVDGKLGAGVTAKDVVLHIIGKLGTAGGTGYAIEFAGSVMRDLSIEGRMTVCNMAIEAGARAGLVAVDQKTIDYVEGRPMAPAKKFWPAAVAQWRELMSDEDAVFDSVLKVDADDITPQLSWGNSPEMVIGVDQCVPDPTAEPDANKRQSMIRALEYMGLEAGQSVSDIPVDRVFIGSCTNSRIEDLRLAASAISGRKVAANVKQAMVVAGSGLVKAQAEKEGLDQIFAAAGFEWREPGCSMCLAMNADKLGQGEHCASTSNRNFEGRQGFGGRTHLVSPLMAAAAAIEGRFTDVRQLPLATLPASQ